MAGKPKREDRAYSHNWGGKRVPGEKHTDLSPFPITDEQLRLLKRIGSGDPSKGLDHVLEPYNHF